MWFELLRVKLYRYDLKGNINYFELAGGLSYRGFALSIIQATEAKITLQVCLEEKVQGKSTLVRANGRFELARVRVIGSRLYLNSYKVPQNTRTYFQLPDFKKVVSFKRVFTVLRRPIWVCT